MTFTGIRLLSDTTNVVYKTLRFMICLSSILLVALIVVSYRCSFVCKLDRSF